MEAGVRVITPEIRWHYGPTGLNESILSLDVLPETSFDETLTKSYVIATAGADKEVKIWIVHRGECIDSTKAIPPTENIQFVFSLSGHDRSVNCVRFSPDGQYLASASDDATIIIWSKAKSDSADWRWDSIQAFADVSRIVLACGHNGDVTDICWSPDSNYLCSASIDNTCVIWDVKKGSVIERKKDHSEFVQGAAWDPLNEFLVTEGNDRTCRVYSIRGFQTKPFSESKKEKRKCAYIQAIKSGSLEADHYLKRTTSENDAEPSGAQTTRFRMFLDDTCPAFSRRLTWTPEGSYLLTPTAIMRSDAGDESTNAVYGFARGNLNDAALCLPGHEKASVGVRCVPRLFMRRSLPMNESSNFFGTEYRTVFAVVSLNAVYIYDTQQPHPIYIVKDIHYADLTDASWSTDAQMLTISSADGYITIIEFEKEHFGSQLSEKEQQSVIGDLSYRMQLHSNNPRKKMRLADKRTKILVQGTRKDKFKSPLIAAFKNSADTKEDSSVQGRPTEPHMVQVRKAK